MPIPGLIDASSFGLGVWFFYMASIAMDGLIPYVMLRAATTEAEWNHALRTLTALDRWHPAAVRVAVRLSPPKRDIGL